MNSIIKDRKCEIALLILIALFPIYKMAVISITIILFVVISVYLFFRKRTFFRNKKQKLKFFLLTTGFYFWMALSLLYSSNVERGLSELQHGLSLVILPLVIFFFIDRISKKIFDIICVVFIGANFLLVLYLQYHFYIENLYDRLGSITFYNLPFRERVTSLPFKDLNPTYLSMWFLFCVLLLTYFLFNMKRKDNFILKSLAIVLIFAFFSTTILLSSRITILAFVVALIVYMFLRIKKVLHKVIMISTTVLIFCIMVFNISFLKSRLIDEFKVTEIAPPKGNLHNSVNIRVGIYTCSWQLVKSNWLLGFGIGDVQNQLNACYDTFETDAYRITVYNSHNQFLHIIMSSGILGLLLFIMMFYNQFKLAWSTKDYLYITFMVFMLICFLTENILVRIHGVLFFAYFNTIFIKRNLKIEES